MDKKNYSSHFTMEYVEDGFLVNTCPENVYYDAGKITQ